MKRAIIAFLSLGLIAAGISASAEDADLVVIAGRVGASSVVSAGYSAYAISGELIDFSAIHTASGLGAEISPFAFRFDSRADRLVLSLVNLTLFHRTFSVNGTSILGPFVAVNWLDFAENRPLLRAGLRFSGRTPWELGDEPIAPLSRVQPLLTILDLEMGCVFLDRPAFYAGCSIDTAIVAGLAAAMIYGSAEEEAEKVQPNYKEGLPPEGIAGQKPEDATAPIAIEQPHP